MSGVVEAKFVGGPKDGQTLTVGDYQEVHFPVFHGWDLEAIKRAIFDPRPREPVERYRYVRSDRLTEDGRAFYVYRGKVI